MSLSAERITDAYITYHERLLRFCFTLCGNEAQAQDLASQVWYELVRMADRYEDRGYPLNSWLFQAARSRCIDAQRIAHRRPTVPLHGYDTFLHAEPFESTLVETMQIQDLLHQLSARHAQVLRLRFAEGRSLAETAEVLGLTVGATKSLQHRALDHIRRVYVAG